VIKPHIYFSKRSLGCGVYHSFTKSWPKSFLG